MDLYIFHLFRSEELCCSRTLYGHTARVWDARLLCNCIVSIGEDVTCRVWDLQGHCREVVKGHKGRSIWSMAVDHKGQVIVSDLVVELSLDVCTCV